jgi:hypothetical protein
VRVRRWGRRPSGESAARGAASAHRPLTVGSCGRGCGMPGRRRQCFGARQVERRAKRDSSLGVNDPRDVGSREDQQPRALLAGADDELGDASFVTPKLFDDANRSKRRVDPEADTVRKSLRQRRSRSVIRCLFEFASLPSLARGAKRSDSQGRSGSPRSRFQGGRSAARPQRPGLRSLPSRRAAFPRSPALDWAHNECAPVLKLGQGVLSEIARFTLE